MGEASFLPVQILKTGANEEKSETARLSTFVGAIVIGELIQSTLGPKGMDKILQSPNLKEAIQVTNDGATILKSIGVDNPVAKILVDMSQKQDSEMGDGTTSVVLLASELLREAEILINKKIHPQTIISGWRSALEVAKSALIGSSFDNSKDPEEFKRDLLNIAMTTLSSKVLSFHNKYFAELAVKAILRIKEEGSLDSIQMIKKLGGSLRDSFLDEGFILDKKIGVSQPKRVEDATILIANTPMDTDKIKVFGSRIKVDSIAKVAELEVAEKQKMKDKVDKILAHGAKVFINRQLIYNYPEQLFADAGVMAIEHADFEGVERLALATGAEIVSTFDNPKLVKLGKCKLIEEIVIGEDRMLRFSGVAKGEACTIVIRGATNQIIDEADRSMHDALCVLARTLRDTKVVYGGGCSEIIMSNAVSDLANVTSGKEAVAIESFSNALKIIPSVIADNGGYDSMELIHHLRALHRDGKNTYGLDMENGCVGDMKELGIFESLAVKMCALCSAVETAEMILRVDHVIHAAPRQRSKDNRR